jgi:hypothetical protein
MFLSNDADFFSLFKQGLIYVKNGLNHLSLFIAKSSLSPFCHANYACSFCLIFGEGSAILYPSSGKRAGLQGLK